MAQEARIREPVSGALYGAEDDFEMGGEFIDVFIRAGDRMVGFLAACLVVLAAWTAWTVL